MMARVMITAAWLLYAASWGLRVHKDGVALPDGVPGWQAFRVAFSAVWPYEDFEFHTWWQGTLGSLSALTNLVMLLSPWAITQWSLRFKHVVFWTSIGALVINAHWWVLYADMRRNVSMTLRHPRSEISEQRGCRGQVMDALLGFGYGFG